MTQPPPDRRRSSAFDGVADWRAGSRAASKETARHFGAADFVQGRIVGLGGSAVTRIAIHKPTGERYALKVMHKGKLLRQFGHPLKTKLDPVEPLLREPRVLAKLQHQFIVGMLGSFQDARCLYLALEYVPGGELMRHLSQFCTFDSETIRFYAAQVVDTLGYMHGLDIVYRGLKPEDLVLAANGYAKFVDFGFAKELSRESQTFTLCGTAEYVAPEVLLNRGHGKPVDWYALGVLVYEMMVGTPPFSGEDPMEVYKQVLDGDVSFPQGSDRTARHLVAGLLHSDPQARLGSGQGGDVQAIRDMAFFDGFCWDLLMEQRLQAPLVPRYGLDAVGSYGEFCQQEQSCEADIERLDEEVLDAKLCAEVFASW